MGPQGNSNKRLELENVTISLPILLTPVYLHALKLIFWHQYGRCEHLSIPSALI